MNRKAQFYLVAAIVIAGVVIGISAIGNYSKKSTSNDISSLRDEIKIESEKTIDYGTKNNFNSNQMILLLQNFTEYYVNYEGSEGKSLYFIFGDENNLTISGNQKENKVVKISSGSGEADVTENSGDFFGSINPSDSTEKVNLDSSSYEFPISSGENFYMIIIQGSGGSEYVTTG